MLHMELNKNMLQHQHSSTLVAVAPPSSVDFEPAPLPSLSSQQPQQQSTLTASNSSSKLNELPSSSASTLVSIVDSHDHEMTTSTLSSVLNSTSSSSSSALVLDFLKSSKSERERTTPALNRFSPPSPSIPIQLRSKQIDEIFQMGSDCFSNSRSSRESSPSCSRGGVLSNCSLISMMQPASSLPTEASSLLLGNSIGGLRFAASKQQKPPKLSIFDSSNTMCFSLGTQNVAPFNETFGVEKLNINQENPPEKQVCSLLDLCAEQVKQTELHKRLRKAQSVRAANISTKVLKKAVIVNNNANNEALNNSNNEQDANRSHNTTIESSKQASENEEAENVASKKMVRFADALGLDLVSVKMICNPESPPIIPKKILKCLQKSAKSNMLRIGMAHSDDDEEDDSDEDDDDDNDSSSDNTTKTTHDDHTPFNYYSRPNNLYGSYLNAKKTPPATKAAQPSIRYSSSYHHDPNSFTLGNSLSYTWKCLFEQPSLRPDFYAQLNRQKVCLESVYTRYMSVNGVVRVLNVCFHKRVLVRYTLDEWRTSKDLACAYLANSNDGHTDRFTFSLALDADQVMQLTDESATKRPPTSFSTSSSSTQPFVQPAAAVTGHIRTSHLTHEPCFSLKFAVCFETRHSESTHLPPTGVFWDNNAGLNYIYECSFKILSPNGSIVSTLGSSQQSEQPTFAHMFDSSPSNDYNPISAAFTQ